MDDSQEQPGQLAIAATTVDGTDRVRLTVSGELDLATKPDLDERLGALLASRTAIELDLSALSFVDSAGLEVLLRYAKAAAREGVELLIGTELSSHVRRLIELTGVHELLWPTMTTGDRPATTAGPDISPPREQS